MIQLKRKGKATRLVMLFTLAILTSISLGWGKAGIRTIPVLSIISSQPASAQLMRSQDTWRQVYEQLPDFPKENQYVTNETGEVNLESTLVSRLIRYHLYEKRRLPNYRFDWKLTLADYLGANEYINESEYPGSNTLTENPMAGDRAAIEKLTRQQREELIEVLVSIYNPNRPDPQMSTPNPQPSPPSTPTRPSNPRLPQPGDADLLNINF
ncbi:hypothetical protein MC7420_415 [Coleofasciculus chthonoplastes PCC 7420]|uniref:Uncharacterized protein n=1 Tax=Coleofasciculus chthonoplastes PCC 7420 TaxID=118168 RepID=B4VLV8_9CYAN|nr:hypothetical protein [Coleofasciculus chthonoplastes]EDX77278.1 hypothetical protein MC7420_415 [Coleofasciculus chthonoplastes PCC 7420]